MAKSPGTVPHQGNSRVVSLRLRDDQVSRLERHARVLGGRSVGSTAAMLLEEKLREEDNPAIDFRNTAQGRQPFLRGTRLKVWQVAMLAREFGPDAGKIARHLQIGEPETLAALAYANRYRSEIEPVVDEVMETTETDLTAYLPSAMSRSGG